MPDQSLQCADCSQAFTFDEGEQKFFKSKGFTPPKRCLDCRKANRDNKGKKK